MKNISVFELSQLVKRLERVRRVGRGGGSGRGGGRRCGRGRGGAGGRENRVHRDLDRRGLQPDQRHQGGPRGDEPRVEGRRRTSSRARPSRSRKPWSKDEAAAIKKKFEEVGAKVGVESFTLLPRRSRQRDRPPRRSSIGRRAVVAGPPQTAVGASVSPAFCSGRTCLRPTRAGRQPKRCRGGAVSPRNGFRNCSACPASPRTSTASVSSSRRSRRPFRSRIHRDSEEKSCDRFLQMNRLPSEREDAGLSRSSSRCSDQRLPREFLAGVHRVFDRQLGVQVRQALRSAPPPQAVQQLWRDAGGRSVRRPRSALSPVRQGEPGARRRLRHLRTDRRSEAASTTWTSARSAV